MTSELARQEPRLSAADFLKQVTPASQRSKLSPWAAEIKLLREAGCSLAQIRDFLAHNGVSVAASTLNAFIGRHLHKVQPAPVTVGKEAPAAATSQATATDTPPADNPAAFKTTKQLASENPKLSKYEIRDLYARQFEATPPNPLDKLIREQEERKRPQREQAGAGGAGASSTTASG
ncbi:hypothetical protein ACQUKI_20740 [Ralstonia pseudosolanacearum]